MGEKKVNRDQEVKEKDGARRREVGQVSHLGAQKRASRWHLESRRPLELTVCKEFHTAQKQRDALGGTLAELLVEQAARAGAEQEERENTPVPTTQSLLVRFYECAP